MASFKCLALNSVFQSQKCKNKIVVIGLMAVCDEHILYQSQHALLSFGHSQK